MVSISTSQFSSLSLEEMYDILRIRATVFVLEQGVVYIDPDGNDKNAVQIYASVDGVMVGCLRIYQLEEGTYRIGRVAVLKEFRGLGIGNAMMKEAIQYLRERTNATKVCLDAQLHAIGFYEKLGFTLFTEEFLEEGLLHRGMQMFFER
ncbi:MAG: GNAT family N-acetyltransferase [Candidatus Coprenecus sp.]|nr:GNAT family N-acetyltransferase [Candidatus Coprenecus sp.]